MAAKIRVSYTEPQELQEVIELLQTKIDTYKVSKGQKGEYKKAYIELRDDKK